MATRNFSPTGKKPDLEINPPPEPRFWQRPGFTFVWIALLAFFTYSLLTQGAQREEIPYSQFLEYLDQGRLEDLVITDKMIRGTVKPAPGDTSRSRRFATVPLQNTELAKTLEEHGTSFTVRQTSDWLVNLFMVWILPLGFVLLLWSWMSRRMGGARSFLSIGGNRVRIHAETAPKVTFDDVAGLEEVKEELRETVQFLRDPEPIQRLGGHMPKGLLLVGPPGTGKTLLARAISGEAGVPFFSISGSEFIEMFVGVGAARIRDLFEQARQQAPCIIFIDELDAIGRSRGGPTLYGGNDEREQTLNQLLSEMDGFDPSSGVVVMAATNRPEVLDKALLRAGRFDRQILVDKPDLAEREAILELHVRQLKLAADVDLGVVAQRTPGFVGADLANIANEAAIRAVRAHHDAITMEDFEEAIDRVVAGPEKKHRVLNAAEKRRVAYHESGHTLVALTVPTGEPVHKVSIIPHGVAALGYTMQLPVEEKFLSTKAELGDQLAILLGGRVAEEIVFGDVSSGAQNDLDKASEIARSMVCQLGMSEKLGPLTYGKRQESLFLGVQYGEEKNYSEETARLIDAEVRELVETARDRAHKILAKHRESLEALAQRLEEKEVLSGDEVIEVVRSFETDTPIRQPGVTQYQKTPTSDSHA